MSEKAPKPVSNNLEHKATIDALKVAEEQAIEQFVHARDAQEKFLASEIERLQKLPENSGKKVRDIKKWIKEHSDEYKQLDSATDSAEKKKNEATAAIVAAHRDLNIPIDLLGGQTSSDKPKGKPTPVPSIKGQSERNIDFKNTVFGNVWYKAAGKLFIAKDVNQAKRIIDEAKSTLDGLHTSTHNTDVYNRAIELYTPVSKAIYSENNSQRKKYLEEIIDPMLRSSIEVIVSGVDSKKTSPIESIIEESSDISELIKRLKGFNKSFRSRELSKDIKLIDTLNYHNNWNDIKEHIHGNFSNNEPVLKKKVIELVKKEFEAGVNINGNEHQNATGGNLPPPEPEPKPQPEADQPSIEASSGEPQTIDELIARIKAEDVEIEEKNKKRKGKKYQAPADPNAYINRIREAYENPTLIESIGVEKDRKALEELIKNKPHNPPTETEKKEKDKDESAPSILGLDTIKNASDIEEVLNVLNSLDANMELEPAAADTTDQKVSSVIQRIAWAREAHNEIHYGPTLIDEARNKRDHWIELLPEAHDIRATVKRIFDAMPLPARPEVVATYSSKVLDSRWVNKEFRDTYENAVKSRNEMYTTLREVNDAKDFSKGEKRIKKQGQHIVSILKTNTIIDAEAIKDWKPEDHEQYKQTVDKNGTMLEAERQRLQEAFDKEENSEDMTKGDEVTKELTFVNDEIAVNNKIQAELAKIHIEPRFETGLYKGMTAAEKDVAVKNYETEKKQLENTLNKIPAHDERHQLLLNRINDLNKSIAGDTDVVGYGIPAPEADLSDEKAFWAEEKKKAQVELDTARDRYIRQMKADKDIEESAGFFKKVLRAPGKLLEEVGIKKPHVSPEYIRLREAYDTAKKRYGNALSNELMEDMKAKQGGNIPSHVTETKKKWGAFGDKVTITVENNLFNSINEQISSLQLKEVAIKEAKALKDAEVEGLPPREKSGVKKFLERYAKQPIWKRALISASIATGISAAVTGASLAAAPAAVVFGTRYLHGVLLAPIAAALGMKVRKVNEFNATIGKNRKMKKLEKQFSVIADVNDLEKLEAAFERNMFRSKVYGWMTTGALAVLSGAQVRNALVESGITVSTGTASPSQSNTPEQPASFADDHAQKIYQEDFDRVSGDAKVDTVNIKSDELDKLNEVYKARIDKSSALTLEQKTGNEGLKFNTEIKQVPQENPPQVAEVGVNKVTKSFSNDIHDVENGKRLMRGDSAELSAKRIFEKNAKALGHTVDSKMSVKKWAEVQVEKLVKDHPEVRNAITHDNNKITIDFDENGNAVNVRIGQGEGRIPTLDGKPIAQSDIDKPITEVQSEKIAATAGTSSANGDSAPKAKVISAPSASTDQIAMQVGKQLPVRVADIFEQKKGFFGNNNALNDPRWIATSTIKADALLKAKLDNIPQFLRSQNVVIDSKLPITRSEIIALKNMIEAGKDYGVLQRNMSVGDVFRKVIEAEVKLKK